MDPLTIVASIMTIIAAGTTIFQSLWKKLKAVFGGTLRTQSKLMKKCSVEHYDGSRQTRGPLNVMKC